MKFLITIFLLKSNELNQKLVETLLSFIIELVIDDELQIARLLRKKLLFKIDKKREEQEKKEKARERSNSIPTVATDTSFNASELNATVSTIKTTSSAKPPQILPYLNSLTKYVSFVQFLFFLHFFHVS